MGRKTLTQTAPEGASDFHFEFKAKVAGAWVEEGKATPKFSKGSGDYPYKVDLDPVDPPFDINIDFVDAGEGPREGRYWWTKNHGERIGEVMQSG
jgi:hypothetical protein